ncbi:hypothetical protein BKA61DRAFT_680489 [Leptodontidium sp. MPI-SDFR-AT-0119]|nr:hypothetical protein BKA61DRAFT_680489 [Leptodontidium sp. MPI-SDFR-AT-0119]
MGNGLCVSSIVDLLHTLQPAERSDALDKLYEQHDEIRTYLKSVHHRHVEAHPLQQQPKRKQPHLEAIHIKKSVPREQTLDEEECLAWKRDVSLFWTSPSHSFLPPENCDEPLRFVLHATARTEAQGHACCLRRRFLALFWFDCFAARYPEHETAFDYEYMDLGRHILGPDIEDSDTRVSKLREQVKAGRKYNMLTNKFEDSILLTLPSSIGWSTLERKLPLDQIRFDTWIEPVVSGVWEELSQKDDIRDLGRRIRRIILQRCLPPCVEGSASPSKVYHMHSGGADSENPRHEVSYPAGQGQIPKTASRHVESIHTRIGSTIPAVEVW